MSSSADPGLRVGVFTTDTDLVIKSWDATLAEMTGIPADRAHGQRLDVLVPDLTTRVSAEALRAPLVSGAVQVLAPAFHKYFIPCPPSEPSDDFTYMQQRVVIGALRNDEGPVGLMITIEDVTRRLERERQLARELRDGSPAARMNAVRELAALDNPDALGPIEAALSDEDWQVRRTAVRALADTRHSALVDTVVEALRDGHRNFSLLSSALQLISTTGVDIADALISLMKHPDTDLRIQVALALGSQQREEAVHALVEAFDDPDVNVRFHAIEAIGQHAYPDAMNRLADIAASGDFFLAFPAIEALVRIGDPLVVPRLAALLENEMLAAVTAQALGRIADEDAVAPLVHALDRPEAPVESIVEALANIHRRYETIFRGADVIEEAVNQTISISGTHRIVAELSRASGDALKNVVNVLSWLRHDAIPVSLAQHLGSADARHEVIEALVRFGGPAASHLIDAIGGDDLDTRRAAIVALGRMGDTSATPALVPLLLDDDERELWVPAAGALARLGDRRAFEALLSRIGDRDAAVRHAVIGALNSIGHPEMSARISGMIDDPDPLVRESAIRIAGYFGYADCADRVFAACQDANASVRAAALAHLPFFDDPRTIDALKSALTSAAASDRTAAAQALGSMHGAAERALLVQALDDSDTWVRYFAAIGLGRHGDAAAAPALVTRAQSDPAVHVSVAAIEAISSIGGDAAVSTLADLAAETGERGEAAVRAIGRVQSERGVEVLREALRSDDAGRRLAAVEALTVDGTDAAVGVLAWTAAADADAVVSRAAMNGLRTVANRQAPSSSGAIRALIETLPDARRRDDALHALAQLDGAAIPLLAEAMTTPDAALRRGVADALSRLSHPAATSRLKQALSDDDAAVRRTAITALSRVGVRGLSSQLNSLAQSDPSPAVRQAATAALHRSGTAQAAGNQ